MSEQVERSKALLREAGVPRASTGWVGGSKPEPFHRLGRRVRRDNQDENAPLLG